MARYAEIKRDYDKVARHTRRYPSTTDKSVMIKARIERNSPGIDETPYMAKVCVVRKGHLSSRCGYGSGSTPTRALQEGLKKLASRLTGSTKYRKKVRRQR